MWDFLRSRRTFSMTSAGDRKKWELTTAREIWRKAHYIFQSILCLLMAYCRHDIDHVHVYKTSASLQWRINERDGVLNHRRLYCLLNRLFRPRSKKTSELRVTGLCKGNPPVNDEFPSQRPITRKMFPLDDVIMLEGLILEDLRRQLSVSAYKNHRLV